MAIHGWGYTRRPKQGKQTTIESNVSSPPQRSDDRPDFVPADAEERLRKGLREMLPELPDRPFEKACLCWYTDTPTGDFIMDYHADFSNLLIAGGGSGHALKFLPALGRYTALAFEKKLPARLQKKWRLRKDYEGSDAFAGDGSRGGPKRRELQPQERARL